MTDGSVAAAQAYDERLVGPLFTPAACRAVALAGVAPGDRVADVACGTAIGLRLAAPAAGPGGMLVGIDSDAGMLSVARARMAVHGADAVPRTGAIERGPSAAGAAVFICADAGRLPVADGAMDVVLCLQGLQFVSDPAAAVAELARVLRPGGRLVLTTWGSLDHVPGHAAVYAALDSNGVDTSSPRRGFALDDPEALATLASAAGCPRVEASIEDLRVSFRSAAAFVDALFDGAPYTRRVLAEAPPSLRAACRGEAIARLAPFCTAEDMLRLPVRVVALWARR